MICPDSRGQRFQLVDLPGIHDLSGSSEDEAIAQRFLLRSPPDLAIVVLNASQIGAQLAPGLPDRPHGGAAGAWPST